MIKMDEYIESLLDDKMKARIFDQMIYNGSLSMHKGVHAELFLPLLIIRNNGGVDLNFSVSDIIKFKETEELK
jgi:hypothetical protein